MTRETGRMITEMRAAGEWLGQALGMEAAAGEFSQWLDVLADRLRHPERPLVVAVCGPTGAGKSHLVNILAGAAVSPSSYRRPSTTAPVLVAPGRQLDAARSRDFLPGYERAEAPGGARFADGEADHRLYLVPLEKPAWPWPGDMALIDTPDFDSVRAANQAQAMDMARRADAVILVIHQAKYADQSVWDFLAGERREERPLLLLLNRLTASAVRDDFQTRLAAAGVASPVVTWPEEAAVGPVSLNAARREVTDWLEDVGRQGPQLIRANGLWALGRLERLWGNDLAPSLAGSRAALEQALTAVDRISREWQSTSRDRVSLNLPGETRESLLKNLGELVRRSDLWDRPRRLLTRPLASVGGAIKRWVGMDGAPDATEKKLAVGLAEAGREALVSAVRDQARALAAAANLPSPQPELDMPPEDIRGLHHELSRRLEAWLEGETERLLTDLPLGKKAAFYFVQFMHLGLVAGLWLQTGGAPGTEVLVGGALGPMISKLTGAVISRETLAAFEERAAARHHQELAAIFHEQGRRYQVHLAGELERLSAGRVLESGMARLREEVERLWA